MNGKKAASPILKNKLRVQTHRNRRTLEVQFHRFAEISRNAPVFAVDDDIHGPTIADIQAQSGFAFKGVHLSGCQRHFLWFEIPRAVFQLHVIQSLHNHFDGFSCGRRRNPRA